MQFCSVGAIRSNVVLNKAVEASFWFDSSVTLSQVNTVDKFVASVKKARACGLKMTGNQLSLSQTSGVKSGKYYPTQTRNQIPVLAQIESIVSSAWSTSQLYNMGKLTAQQMFDLFLSVSSQPQAANNVYGKMMPPQLGGYYTAPSTVDHAIGKVQLVNNSRYLFISSVKGDLKFDLNTSRALYASVNNGGYPSTSWTRYTGFETAALTVDGDETIQRTMYSNGSMTVMPMGLASDLTLFHPKQAYYSYINGYTYYDRVAFAMTWNSAENTGGVSNASFPYIDIVADDDAPVDLSLGIACVSWGAEKAYARTLISLSASDFQSQSLAIAQRGTVQITPNAPNFVANVLM